MSEKQGNRTNKLKLVYNALGFNAAWWGCVLGAKWSMPYLGPSIMLVYLAVHFLLLGHGKREAVFLMAVAVIGTSIDSVKTASGFITYSGGYGVDWLSPLWITSMWVGFAALLNHSLGWLKSRYLVAAILGAVFAPPAYLTGVKFGVIQMNLEQWLNITILAVVWGISVPLLVKLSESLKVSTNANAVN